MNLTGIFFNTLMQFWYLIPILIFAYIVNRPWFKGIFGEFQVNLLLRQLPQDDYTLLKSVTLPTEDGSTQIDHILVSKYGIFVIETKNMCGWIFGSEKQATWTQKIYKHSSKFQNPLRQNYKHVKTLESLLECPAEHLHSVIVFIGDRTFKTEMPKNVTYARGCLRFINRFKQVVFTQSQVNNFILQIENLKLKPGIKTSLAHVQHVKEIVVKKEATNSCPRCGSEMVERKATKGDNAGKKFWGCSQFPKCRGIVKF